MKGKQIVFERKGQAVLADMDVPTPGAGHIVIENDYTVISAGTVFARLAETNPMPLGIVFDWRMIR